MFCQLCEERINAPEVMCFMCSSLFSDAKHFEHICGMYKYSWVHYWDEDQAKRVARNLEERLDFLEATPRKKEGTSFWDIRLKKDRPSPMIKSAHKCAS